MEKEKRLIDANAVPKLFEKKYEETEQRILDGESYLDTLAEGFTEADDVILSMPTVDAVEVVRCRDCKHWLNEDGLDDHVCLKIYSDGTVSSYAWQDRNPDDFCSYGERITDNG